MLGIRAILHRALPRGLDGLGQAAQRRQRVRVAGAGHGRGELVQHADRCAGGFLGGEPCGQVGHGSHFAGRETEVQRSRGVDVEAANLLDVGVREMRAARRLDGVRRENAI